VAFKSFHKYFDSCENAIHTCVVGDIGVNDVKCDVIAILVEEDAAGGELAR